MAVPAAASPFTRAVLPVRLYELFLLARLAPTT